ncbi:unnamed protein product, partial [Bubo scandiacus]
HYINLIWEQRDNCAYWCALASHFPLVFFYSPQQFWRTDGLISHLLITEMYHFASVTTIFSRVIISIHTDKLNLKVS